MTWAVHLIDWIVSIRYVSLLERKILKALLYFIFKTPTDAITRLCSCGPTKFVVELLASVKIECASSSWERVSDIFCAIVEVGFN